jgi:hypothetical protein
MKIARLVAMAALAGIIVKSGEARQATARKVTVCMNESLDGPVIEGAEAIVSRTFKAIGVKTEWHDLGRDCPVGDEVIRIQLLTVSPEHYHPGAFAFAWPYEGVHIQVFGDRMERLIGHHDLQYVLAHVLVHEITHLLQGVNRHSSSGIMKAGWDNQDYAQMRKRPLSFTELDVTLIQRGMDAKAARRQGVATAAGIATNRMMR